MFKKHIYIIVLLTGFFSNKGISQIIFYEDVFYGGVTGYGINPYTFETTGDFNLNIEPGSTIRKAFLFISVMWYDSVNDNSLIFNNQILNLSIHEALHNNYVMETPGLYFHKYRTLVIDVTDLLNPLTTTYTLTTPINQNSTGEGGVFSDYYLLVTYNNPSLNKVNTVVTINNQDAQQLVSYSFIEANPIDLTNNVGFAFNSVAFCDTTTNNSDGSYVYVDGSMIGLVGGSENNFEPACTGVRGAFYYQNSTVYGLDNDTPDNIMGGVDCLASIESYINDPNNFNIEFDYQNNGGSGNKTNPLHELFLTYTTPCDTFSVSVPNDTTVCKGAQVQLNISGGQSYEWASTSQATGTVPGLSCSDCPNPFFTADSSMTYTVRIWSNDSCSVVRPIKINVAKDPAIETFAITATECGTSQGKVVVSPSTTSFTPFTYTLDNTTIQASSTFNNLSAGAHQLHLEDARGCSSDTTFFVPQTISAQANFQTTPLVGFTPHDIYLLNTSTNASDYLWQIDGANQGNDLTHYTFNDQGTFEITLIAWKYDPSCSDTISKIAYVKPQLIIPTAFTPDNDLINDTWEIEHLDEMYPENIVQIYNRWGELLFESQAGNYNSNPWNGTYNNKPLPIGSYYFIIQTNEEEAGIVQGTVSLVFSY